VSVLDDGRPLRIATERDRIGQGAWARLFASAAVGDEGSSSAEAGRTLARDGRVHTVTVSEGVLGGRVDHDGVEQTAEIAADPVSPRIWAAATRSARCNPQLEAAVAGRSQSDHLEHVMAGDRAEPLVPATRSLRRTCTCGRPGTCAHLAALAYALADRIDREPSLLLRWRGCTEPVEQAEPSSAEPDSIVSSEEIWEAGPLPQLGPPRPLPPAAVLKRLGKSRIQVGAQDLAEVLERAYASFAASGRR